MTWPEDGTSHKPEEIWDVFNTIKLNLGEAVINFIKLDFIKKLIKKLDGTDLLLSLCLSRKKVDSPNNPLSKKWGIRSLKRLESLSNDTNVMLKKLKLINKLEFLKRSRGNNH